MNVIISLNVEGKGEIDICEDAKLEIFYSDGRVEEIIFDGCKGKAPQINGKESVEVRFSWGDYQMIFPKVPTDWISYKKEISWKFRIVYPPIRDTSVKNKENLLHVEYFTFDFHEGQALEIINPIYK
ncbi:hypothetical protein [Cyclobacterium marinum]|uniref:hypothetical protein n=1 Tax=Cyclobacterium marinum TaxID=104 RepID=UPI0011EBE67F|nr:hypothetical protein [Cyclobacterium marinum]MBI0397957.1 hypothetical protein [Cyclobacterium marinum]